MNKTTPIIIIALVLVIVGAWAIFSYSNQRYLAQNPGGDVPNQMPENNDSGMMGGQTEGNTNPVAAALTKSDKGEGNVTISLTYITSKFVENDNGANAVGSSQFDLDKNIVLMAVLDTHSVDLSKLKLEDISFIEAGDGREVKALSWKAISEGSHHRSGFIVFPATDENDGSIITSGTKSLTAVIKDVSDIKERIFNWTLPIEYSAK